MEEVMAVPQHWSLNLVWCCTKNLTGEDNTGLIYYIWPSSIVRKAIKYRETEFKWWRFCVECFLELTHISPTKAKYGFIFWWRKSAISNSFKIDKSGNWNNPPPHNYQHNFHFNFFKKSLASIHVIQDFTLYNLYC